MIQQISLLYSQIILPGYSSTLEPKFSESEIFKSSEVRNEQSSVYLLSQNLIDLLNDIYIFKNPKEIKRFLLSNKDLIGILLSAYEHIRRIFGDSPIYLELHHDPEEDWDELFIIIKSDYPPEKAVELENKLFKEWFIEVLDKVGTRLNFTEEPL